MSNLTKREIRFSKSSEEKLERRVSDIALFKKTIEYTLPFKKRLAILAVLMLLGSIYGLIVPFFTKVLVDDIITPGVGSGERSGLNWWLFIMVLLAIGGFGLLYSRRYLTAWIGAKITYQLKEDMFSKLQIMSMRYFTEGETGRIMSRVTGSGSWDIANFMGSLFDVIVQFVSLSGSLFLMASINLNLTLISLATVPLMTMIPFIARTRIRRLFRQFNVKVAGLTSFLQESISGVRIVQAFSRERHEIENFDVTNEETLQAYLRAEQVNILLLIGVEFSRVMGTVIILWYGATQIVTGAMTVGELMAFQILMIQFLNPLSTVVRFYGSFQTTMAGAERVFELLEAEEEIEEPREGHRMKFSELKGEIRFEHVTFGYEPNLPVLKDFNLAISPNEKISLVGPTGGGKTTVIKLLCRFYDPQQGNITIDGYDIRNVSLKSLRSQMGIVPQDVFLFEDTIRNNIKYGNPGATDEEVITAARIVGAHDFIAHLPEGYDTLIREGSTNISFGQRQLITFARALLINPKILILDEATSSVDPYTETIIHEGLKKLLKNRTSIIIAHRLSTVRNSDRIVVIDNGRIVELGNHQQLLKKGGLYSRLYEMQFREPETVTNQ